MPTYFQPEVKTLYTFDELEPCAKEKAREWYREGALDHDWWDAVYEDAKQCGAIIGIEIDRIYFSGFSSQGDGACFEGSYSYAKGAAKAISQHAPQDVELHRIADELQALQRANFYRLSARMKHSGHYSHSGCMSVDVDDSETRREGWLEVEQAVTQLMRDFADWIYRQLETEHDWLNADEQVDDSIRANEYTFDAEGNRAG
jgi:hypothetical protein